MSLQHLQQLPHRPIMRDGITDGFQALEPEAPLLVALHDAPLARLVAVVVLHVVVARAVRLPDVDLDAGDGPAERVLDGADGQHGLAGWVRGHAAAVGEEGGIVRVEGAEDGALGSEGRFGVVDVVY